MSKPNVQVTPITDPSDLTRFFEVAAAAFGTQANDGLWTAMSPGWDTPEGKKNNVSRLTKRLNSTTKDRNGEPNTIFLKAVVNAGTEKEAIAGIAIWAQASMVDGYGDVPRYIGEAMDLNELYPGNEKEQRYVSQLDASLHKRRFEVIREIATTSSPAVMVLDLCAVDPAFQRMGVASRLVQWGLDEAKRRGGLEAVLEGSSMGRHVYRQLGFWQDGDEVGYEVDEEFKDRERPSNIFMRTGR
ncbi:hypothetical protein BDV18DRAFT_24927 [Aspergillus unguis]